MDENKIKIYSAGHCGPCQKVSGLLKEGLVEVDIDNASVELIDIETEEGFAELKKVSLSAVPMAFLNDKACKLLIDEEKNILVINCKPEAYTPTSTS